jgi:AAA+ ATPase superfamily predicted ATPase
MNGFIGREKQLGLLNEWYSSGEFEFVAMYGRRRVGKTAIIKQFIKDKRTIFFTATRSKGDMNLRLFNESVKGTLNIDADRTLFFDKLFRIIGDNADERLVLVIDEFPYFAESNEELLSLLQIFIDHIAQNTKLFLILCGSSMSFMKRQVLGYESPLYGRRTRELHIRPMDFMEAAEFLPGKSNYEKACIYGAVGGIPMYLSRFSGKGNVFDMITNEFFSEGSVMASEPDSLILQELKDPKRYNGIIEALAKGKTRLSDISDRSGILTGEVSKCLADLIDLGYVEKLLPFNEKGDRHTRYHISDNMFRFYYWAVVDNKDIRSKEELKSMAKQIELQFPEYMGRVFETMCSQYVGIKMGYPNRGKWWGTPSKNVTAEIDLIGSVKDLGKTEGLFAECKFTKRQTDMEDLASLKEKADHVKGFDTKRYALFSKSGFTDRLTDRAEVEGVALITLDMMYDTV